MKIRIDPGIFPSFARLPSLPLSEREALVS